MKKYGLPLAVILALFSLASCTTSYVVRDRPREVVYFRPAAPSRAHVWVSGDWIWTGGRYQWREGYWATPRRGNRWADGHWQNTRHGYKWIPGHWQRR